MNKKIIIATHGKLAAGLKDAIAVITKIMEIESVCCFCDDIKDTDAIRDRIIALMGEQDEDTIVFTDLFGGSVNKTIVPLIRDYERLFVVTGANLATILEFVCSQGDTEELLIAAVEAGKNDIRFMNSIVKGED